MVNCDKKICEELFYYLNREYNKLKIVFSKVKLISNEYSEVWQLVLSYWEDCKYFYNQKDYVKAFELINYVWGMLDILANLRIIKVPEDIKKWFKIE